MAQARAVTVVKLGGSHAFAPHLGDWLDALAACGGRVVVVPGGGPFADAVRLAQERLAFGDGAAHHMALLAMEQFGCALASLGRGMTLSRSLAAIQRALQARLVPVWLPTAMVLDAAGIPASWDVTSDSLAAWLAGRLRCRRLLLVKHVDALPAVGGGVQELAAAGIVDPAFAAFLGASGADAYIVGPADHAAAARAIRNGTAAGLRVASPAARGRAT
jgi:5-(aminomethyl)-3-furanmethanol phosphate kinase